jgi:DNA processing protein
VQPLIDTPIVRLLPGATSWPSLLSDLDKPPGELALQGKLPELAGAVAIVGTRRASPEALAFTRVLAAELAEAGRTIVSGGAAGIDSAAHRGALDVDGMSLAVLPTGLLDPYPPHNRALFAELLAHGALLSESAELVPGYPSRFLARNRLIAALASVVVVVQAPLRSGALSTAAHATRLGRPLLVVPGAPWEPLAAGCLTLLAAGARVCRSSADVLSLAAPTGVKPPRHQLRRPKKAPGYQDLDEDERGVSEALKTDALSADELCERTGLSAPRVQRAVLMLMLSRVIQEVGCGRYARTTRL